MLPNTFFIEDTSGKRVPGPAEDKETLEKRKKFREHLIESAKHDAKKCIKDLPAKGISGLFTSSH